jgi:hypothetical protein
MTLQVVLEDDFLCDRRGISHPGQAGELLRVGFPRRWGLPEVLLVPWEDSSAEKIPQPSLATGPGAILSWVRSALWASENRRSTHITPAVAEGGQTPQASLFLPNSSLGPLWAPPARVPRRLRAIPHRIKRLPPLG